MCNWCTIDFKQCDKCNQVLCQKCGYKICDVHETKIFGDYDFGKFVDK